MPGAERRLLALPHRCAPGKVAARQAGRKPGRRRQGQPATAQAVSQMSGAGTPRAHSARCRLTVTQPVLGPGTWACRLSGPVAAPTIPTTRTPAPSPRQPGCSSRKLPGGLCPAPARAPGGGDVPWRLQRHCRVTHGPCPLHHAGVCAGPVPAEELGGPAPCRALAVRPVAPGKSRGDRSRPRAPGSRLFTADEPGRGERRPGPRPPLGAQRSR